MIARAAGCFLAVEAILAAGAWGDMVAMDISRMPIEYRGGRIRLATVNVLLRRATWAEMEKAKPAGPGRQWVAAEVEGDFEVGYHARQGQIRRIELLDMAFPIRCLTDEPCLVTRFDVGGPNGVEDLKPMDRWDLPAGAGEGQAYSGYSWRTSIVETLLRTKVAYRLLLPVHGEKARFRYVIRSGGAWPNPIAKETVTVRAADGLLAVPAASASLCPNRSADGAWVWTLVDTRPAEDIEVLVHVRPAPGWCGTADMERIANSIEARRAEAEAALQAHASPALSRKTFYMTALAAMVAAGVGFVLYVVFKSPRWAF